MNERLYVALLAMDRLNSFARTHDGHGPRRAIYWLKSRYAIRDAIMAGSLAKMRAIQVTTRCHKCRDGIYFDWDGISRGSCYTCNGRGKVTLKFIETTTDVEPGTNRTLVWHSPIQYSSWLGWPTDDLEFSEAQDWTVKQEGKSLTVVELAEAMNIVETYWPWWRKHSPYELSREEYDSHRYYIFNYALNLGEDDPKRGCAICGAEHNCYCYATAAPGLTRGFSVCVACNKDPEVWAKLKALPIPQLHPEIQYWRERHALNFNETWGQFWFDKWCDRRRQELKEEVANPLFKIPAEA